MKKLFFVFFLVANVIQAQDVEPKNVIENFFNGFHKKDTLALRATTHKDIVMQSVATTKEGNKVTTESFSNFLKSNTSKFLLSLILDRLILLLSVKKFKFLIL